MKYIDKPYISSKIKHPKSVIRRFRFHKFLPGTYIIRTAEDPDQLEIIRADYYREKAIRREDKYIVGFAADYDDACDMILDITQKALTELGRPSIKEYIFR